NYDKGAYVIHSLRYIIGDEIFFPMLKAFLSIEQYTYHNLVETKDFTGFVQQYSGRDLDDFFQLYLYTTDIPQLKVARKGKNNYAVSSSNFDFTLPMDIQTSNGTKRVEISDKPALVQSESEPIVDPEGWYLKQK